MVPPSAVRAPLLWSPGRACSLARSELTGPFKALLARSRLGGMRRDGLEIANGSNGAKLPSMSKPASFVASVGGLRTFFSVPADATLAEAVASMNDAMGLANSGPLPDQVRRLMEATGLEIARDGTVSSAGAQAGGGAAPSSAGSAAGPSADSDLHTSLPGIGLAPDTKLAKSLAKHKARQTTLTAPPPDERKQKIFQYQEFLRIPPKGASSQLR